MTFRLLRGIRKVKNCYLMQFDGNAKPNPGNISGGIVIFSPEPREVLFELGIYEKGKKNNNASECIALIHGLEHALEHDIYDLIVEGDSQFALNMLSNNVKVKEDYKAYSEKIKVYSEIFNTLGIEHIPRKDNEVADQLSNEVRVLKTDICREFIEHS